jgi:hypothetical protein
MSPVTMVYYGGLANNLCNGTKSSWPVSTDKECVVASGDSARFSCGQNQISIFPNTGCSGTALQTTTMACTYAGSAPSQVAEAGECRVVQTSNFIRLSETSGPCGSGSGAAAGSEILALNECAVYYEPNGNNLARMTTLSGNVITLDSFLRASCDGAPDNSTVFVLGTPTNFASNCATASALSTAVPIPYTQAPVANSYLPPGSAELQAAIQRASLAGAWRGAQLVRRRECVCVAAAAPLAAAAA